MAWTSSDCWGVENTILLFGVARASIMCGAVLAVKKAVEEGNLKCVIYSNEVDSLVISSLSW